jgi:hypothetical protein
MFEIFTKIGFPGLIVILFIVVYLFSLRLREKAANYALMFILASKLLNQIVGGFTFSANFGSVFGEVNTVLTYLLLALAFSEAFFFKGEFRWPKSNHYVFIGLYVLGVGYISWAFYTGLDNGMNNFAFLLSLSLFIYSKPVKEDLRLGPILAFLLITILLLCAILRYQNPYFPYYQTDYGVDGPYHNFLWEVFGFTERFRGPYIHPNHLGFNVVFIAVLSTSYKSRLTHLTLLMSFMLLLLCGSRTSIFAFSLLIILKYFILTKRIVQTDRKWLESTKIFNRRTSIFLAAFVISLSVIIQNILAAEPTLNGRTNNYMIVFNNLKGNYLLGAGVPNAAESTVVTILGEYGTLGLLSMILIISGLSKHFAALPNKFKIQVFPVAITFFAASFGESLLDGGTYDIGLLYMFIILTLKEIDTPVQRK